MARHCDRGKQLIICRDGNVRRKIYRGGVRTASLLDSWRRRKSLQVAKKEAEIGELMHLKKLQKTMLARSCRDSIGRDGGRVAQGGCPLRAPTDPDVRN